MTTKKCSKCGEIKPTTDFYRHKMGCGGVQSWCMDCHNAYRRAYRLAHLQQERRRNREWYFTNRDHNADRQKVYVLSHREQRREYCRRRKVGYIAGSQLKRAVGAGRIVAHPCELCGTKKVGGHHHDYSKPLEVNWLCHPCHMFVHRVLRAIAQPLAELEALSCRAAMEKRQ